MHPFPVYLGPTRYDPLLATIEHAIPVTREGGHDRENVSLAHYWCNQSKNDRTPEEYAAWQAG